MTAVHGVSKHASDVRTILDLAPVDVTATRAFATDYQNTSGNPMWVFVTGILTTAGNTITAYTETGTPIAEISARGEASANGDYVPVSFIVPNNWYYKVNVTAGSLYKWVEVY